MERWEGKTAVVTGASAGIGAAVCVTLANAGLQVVGLARRAPLVEKLNSSVSGKGKIHARQCDVGDLDSVRTTFRWIEETLGGVDVLVNNAGLFVQGNITDVGSSPLKDGEIASIIDVNLKGPIFCTRHAVASMKRRGFDGHVITVNSIAGHYVPFSPDFNIYPSSKHGVTGFTGSLLNELAMFSNKIKVTSISPGLVNTEMIADAADKVDFTPLRAQDVADAVLYVVSTPPNVNITELTIRPVAEKRL